MEQHNQIPFLFPHTRIKLEQFQPWSVALCFLLLNPSSPLPPPPSPLRISEPFRSFSLHPFLYQVLHLLCSILPWSLHLLVLPFLTPPLPTHLSLLLHLPLLSLYPYPSTLSLLFIPHLFLRLQFLSCSPEYIIGGGRCYVQCCQLSQSTVIPSSLTSLGTATPSPLLPVGSDPFTSHIKLR